MSNFSTFPSIFNLWLNSGKTVRSTTSNPGDQEQVRNQAEKIKKLMMLLEEKDEQLQELEQLKEEERVQAENQEELLHRLQVKGLQITMKVETT